jgi:hypothetical protein
MHVKNIVVTRTSLNGNRSRVDATITIEDASNNPISGATVNGDFTGPSSSSESGTTNINGEVSFSSRAVKNPVGEWCFEVTSVSMTGATYDVGANVVTQACESGPVAKSAMTNNKNNFNSNSDLFMSSFKVYPNPFQNSVKIAFQLEKQLDVNIEIYSVLGKRLAVISNQNYEAGHHLLDWNGQRLSNGIYLLKIKAGERIDTRRLILMR